MGEGWNVGNVMKTRAINFTIKSGERLSLETSWIKMEFSLELIRSTSKLANMKWMHPIILSIDFIIWALEQNSKNAFTTLE